MIMNQILGKFMKQIKKRVNKDQFLNSKYARKSKNFIDILVFLFGLFYATIRYGFEMKVFFQTGKFNLKSK